MYMWPLKIQIVMVQLRQQLLDCCEALTALEQAKMSLTSSFTITVLYQAYYGHARKSAPQG